MNITMNNVHIRSIEDITKLMQAPHTLTLTHPTREERYGVIVETLVGVRYKTLRKKDAGIVQDFLVTVTGYSYRQVKRLVREWKSKKGLRYAKRKPVGAARRIYGPEDIALLIKTDILHKTPNGRSTQEILKREYLTFGHNAYKTIAGISVSHIYNIRNHNEQYRSSEALRYSKTNPVSVAIGERTKPQPYGKPGYIRVDSVHQGDRDKEKGVYHVNLVDEVTQWQVTVCVEGISEHFLLPALARALTFFPFVLHNFHSDNGSEYVNKQVAGLLEKLRIHQTKSRSRRTNDNALVEGKNGSTTRKEMGHGHIPKKHAPFINAYYEDHFNVYLNYHRICAYATDYTDARGKVCKKYESYMTPYEKLKSLENAAQYLKPGVTFAELDALAYAQSDNEFAQTLADARAVLRKQLQK
jgi:hypothetical protein